MSVTIVHLSLLGKGSIASTGAHAAAPGAGLEAWLLATSTWIWGPVNFVLSLKERMGN